MFQMCQLFFEQPLNQPWLVSQSIISFIYLVFIFHFDYCNIICYLLHVIWLIDLMETIDKKIPGLCWLFWVPWIDVLCLNVSEIRNLDFDLYMHNIIGGRAHVCYCGVIYRNVHARKGDSIDNLTA